MTGSGTGLGAEVYRGPAGLEALRPRWQTLQAQLAVQRFFHAWDWYQAWLLELAERPEEVCFIAVERAGRLLAVVPLVPTRRPGVAGGLRVLELPAHSHLPLADVLCHPELDAPSLLRAVADGLRRGRVAWDLLQFDNVLDESVLARCVVPAVPRAARHMLKTCDFIGCDRPWDDYAAGLSANFRSNLNKARNKLAREAAVEFEIARAPDALRAMMPDFLQIEASGWKGDAGTAILRSPRLAAFYARLLATYGARDAALLSRLRVAGRTIAAEFCLVDNATLYMIKLAYDESAAKLSPGNSLLERMFRSIHKDLGLRYVNLVGSPPWFAHWNPERVPVWRVRVYNSTLAGRLEWLGRGVRAAVGSWLRRRRAASASE